MSVRPDRNTPRIEYLPRAAMGPLFGFADPARQTVWIRDDLPRPVRAFVLEHERYHLNDRASWWVWREIKANAVGAKKHPWGFLQCLGLSCRRDRLQFYLDRIRRGE